MDKRYQGDIRSLKFKIIIGNAMAKLKKVKRQTTMDKTHHKKLQHEHAT